MNLRQIGASLRHTPGDPKVLHKGPGSLGAADRLARALGWFSLALGAVELVAPRQISRRLGVGRADPLIRAFGAREIATGIGALGVDPRAAIVGRIGGDALDLAALGAGLRGSRGRQRQWLFAAIAAVGAVALLDVIAAQALQRRHARRTPARDYSHRSGFPRSPEQMRGAARDFGQPRMFADGESRSGAEVGTRPHG